MGRKTPKEKKEADYKKQRRTHWDNDKAARKAIPAAKRAARQIIRKRSDELIHTTLVEPEEAPTAAELAEIEKHNRYQSYGHGETLREHVDNQQRGRGPGIVVGPWSVPELRLQVKQPYRSKLHRRPMIDFFHSWDRLSSRQNLRKDSLRTQFMEIFELAETPFVLAFFQEEPHFLDVVGQWRKRFASASSAPPR